MERNDGVGGVAEEQHLATDVPGARTNLSACAERARRSRKPSRA
jgi:hypothetical protein